MVKKKKTTKQTAAAKKKAAAKNKPNFNIAVGNRIEYGRILGVWDDPFVKADKWVFIKNDDSRVYESFSLYKHKNQNGGELMLTHFIPPCIMQSILDLDLAVEVNKKNKIGTGGKKKGTKSKKTK